jgi:hypothetical protein
MTQAKLSEYFSCLDSELSDKGSKLSDRFIAESFPNYSHVGKYVDPRDQLEREYYRSQLANQLEHFSFDPLISFEMSQIKYSKEILHPECSCFRRKKTKLRPIKTCSHRDRILYAAWNHHLSCLHKKWLSEEDITEVVSAYVPKTGKFNAHHAKKAFDYIQGRSSYSARAIDIRSFFDKIPHKVLKENLTELLGQGQYLDKINYKLLTAVTKYTFIDLIDLVKHMSKFESGPQMYLSRTKKNWNLLRKLKIIKQNSLKGIPQGLACSGVLANIVMMKIDLQMVTFAKANDSLYLRYADDIFLASPSKPLVDLMLNKCSILLDQLDLPIAEEKTEKYDYMQTDQAHPILSYLGLTCKGEEIGVRMNGVNKFYQRTSQFIFSYVITCRKRKIKPSLKKIRAIFSHSGSRNYYSYLRRASIVFQEDERYKPKGIKGILKNHGKWIEDTFRSAEKIPLPKTNQKFKPKLHCTCPLNKDD